MRDAEDELGSQGSQSSHELLYALLVDFVSSSLALISISFLTSAWKNACGVPVDMTGVEQPAVGLGCKPLRRLGASGLSAVTFSMLIAILVRKADFTEAKVSFIECLSDAVNI
jgi:hypothetical protein